jgi:hypothetical protein
MPEPDDAGFDADVIEQAPGQFRLPAADALTRPWRG